MRPSLPRMAALGLVLALALAWYGPAPAGSLPEQPVRLTPAFNQAQVIPRALMLRDPTNQLTFAQVRQAPWSQRFQPAESETLGQGLDGSNYWFRFRLEGPSPGQWPRLILAVTRPLVMLLEVYAPTRDQPPGEYRRLSAGFIDYDNNQDLGQRIRALALPRDVRPGEDIYVLVRSTVASYALTLFSQNAFDRNNRFEFLFFGLCTGVMLAMFLYNLAIAAFLRDRVYATYCAYLVAMIPCTALHTGWPLAMGLHPEFFVKHVLQFCSMSFILGALFSRAFLATKGRHPWVNRIFWGIVILGAVDFALNTAGFFDLANASFYAMGFALPVVMVVCAAVVWRAGYSPARYYLLAWSVLFVSTITYAASGLGLIGHSFLVYNMVLLGAAVESILLSLALADRIRLMARERSELRKKERRLTELSITDELTGLYNKRWFSSKLSSEVDHAQRLGLALSLLVADVDHFKLFNDTHGHATGDKVLAGLGQVIGQAVRNQDIPCRYGGEEFVVILPGLEHFQAVRVGERLRASFAALTVTAPGQGEVGATISVGVAQMAAGDTMESLFERADQALYQAKSQGRDQVVSLD